MKKFLVILLALVGTLFLYSPGYFLGGWILNNFCSVFTQINACSIPHDPYNLSTFESIFIILGIAILWSLAFFMFYKDNKKTKEKAKNGKKIKSFRLV